MDTEKTFFTNKEMIFFTKEGKGLNSTSANHVANLAKEMIRNIEATLSDMVLYSTQVSLIGGDKPNVLNTGATDDDVKGIASLLHQVADAKSLIAWLREGIKAKEKLLQETNATTLEQFAKIEGTELKEQPKSGHILTEDEYWGEKSVEERCRYYELETVAATLGKAIHPGGAFADAREQLQQKSKKPHDVKGDGRDTLIFSYTPTVDGDLVEEVYFTLQKQYREAQSRLNSMKHDCQKAIEESAVKVRTEYSKEMADWTNNRKLIEARHAEYIQKRTKELAELRIIIPDSLQEIYETVSSLGKNK